MTPSPGVTALTDALQLLRLAQIGRLTADELHVTIARIEQGRAVLVQTETDLKVCTESSLAAHQRVNALEAGVEELYIRESVAMLGHEERIALLQELRHSDPEFRTFVVSTDTPRPTAAPL